MTETAADYRRAVHARHRAAAIDRIADGFADGRLTDLPDLLLIIIERALDRDLQGITEMAHDYRGFAPKSSTRRGLY